MITQILFGATVILGGVIFYKYETDSLEELGTKYQELLSTYTTEQLKLVEELDVEFIVTVTDN